MNRPETKFAPSLQINEGPLRRPRLNEADRRRGQRIKALREQLNESQAKFGDRFGVEQATVSRWEKGEPIKRTLMSALAAAAQKSVPEFFYDAGQTVPLLSWVAASALADVGDVPESADAPMIPAPDLGPGEWFALKVRNDSMNRIACDGSIIFVRRDDKLLVPKGFYIFTMAGEATFKRYATDPDRLEPYSTNPVHEAIFPNEELHIGGRVWRVQLDLR